MLFIVILQLKLCMEQENVHQTMLKSVYLIKNESSKRTLFYGSIKCTNTQKL